ncbi:MAG: hypothetical protein M1814_003012 [Vezdaea aestivalis]|nr:MAG: hypothetical protein M1814_003012 [Vezdaea aestivalis]
MDEARLAQLDVGPQSQGLHHSDIANQEAQSPVEGNARNHYFKPRRMRVRKGNAFSAPNSQEKVEKFVIRTIAPESIERAPYLTLPDSVESLSSDEERAGTLNWVPEDTFIFRGRPESSSLFTEQLPVPQPSSQSKPQRKQPRHSFSVSDMFVSASPSRKNKSAGQEGGPSARLEHGKRRASIPTNELPTTPQPSSDSGLSSRVTANSSRDTSIPRSNSHSQRNSPSDHQLSHSDLLPQFSDLHLNSGGRSDARDRNTMMTYTTTSRAPSNPIMTSPLASSNKQQGQRLSFVASSERASTLLGSDGEGRGFTSGDDDEMSETVFDSLRTGATNSSLGTRGPRADRIFDENAQIDTEKTSLNAFHGLTINDTPPSSASITRQSNHDEHELLPTAGKDFTSTGHESSDETRAATRNDSIEDWASAHSRVEDENRTPNRGLSNHDDDDDDEEWERNAEPRQEYNTPLSSPSLGRLPKDPSHPPGNAPHQQIHSKKMVRDSLFDWAEQSQHDRNGSGGYRPQTVHGKRANGARGGRSDGRRGPSALHVRSQSVPVVPDVEGNREHATNKFGTWGLGSKVVSEDWDNDYDFDFDLAKAHSTQDKETSVQTVSAPVSMIVPKAIKESQASVIGNLGYIREFALLVENLKRLRARAAEMRIIEGPAMDLWKEAEAMIDLATVDNDEPEALTQTISANGLHLDGFDDEWTPISFSPRGRRKSVLALEDDIFGSASEPILPLDSRHSQDSQASKGSQTKRKQSNVDTASIAKSVIETMQHRRQVSNTPIPNPSPSKSDKLSFDTTTLHDLVAHVNTLARKLAEIIRENDGTAFESRSLESGNAITKLFVDPSGV